MRTTLPPSTPAKSQPVRRFYLQAWFYALLAVVGFIAADSTVRLTHNQYLNEIPPVLVQSVLKDGSSETGYVPGERARLFPVYGIDGYHWIMQTQQMFERGEWRIRHVQYDNAPLGREVHWGSPFRWWLGLCAWVDHQITGVAIGYAVERAGLYVNPLLLILFLCAFVPVVARKLGNGAAVGLVVGLGTMVSFYGYFYAANPDHHGLVAATVVVAIMALAIALKETDQAAAKRWLRISAISGGLGLWISAATVVPMLAAAGVGAFVVGFWAREPVVSATAWCWRYWGRWGCGASMAAWLLEYFPGDMSMRLEVNHPLYALAWLGGGEVIALWLERIQYGRSKLRGQWQLRLALAGAAIVALPVVICVGGSAVFVVREPFLWQLHHDYIQEFQPIGLLAREAGRGSILFSLLAVAVLAAVCLGGLLQRKLTGPWRAIFAVSAAVMAVYIFMGITQVRWLGMAGAMCVVMVSLRLAAQEDLPLGKWAKWRFGVLAGLAVIPMLSLSRDIFVNRRGVTTPELCQLTEREIALWLRLRTGAEVPVVVTSPGLGTVFAYQGRMKTLGTLYWENADGLRAAADLLGADNAEQAYRIAQQRGVTHLLFASWSDFVAPYVKIGRGMKLTDEVPDGVFVNDLVLKQTPPSWLKPVACNLPDNPALATEQVILFEVVAPRSREQALVDFVNFLIDSERMEQAMKFMPVLKTYPAFYPARIVRARLELLNKREAEFVESIKYLVTDTRALAALSLSDRVQWALELAVIGDDANAAREFAQCWQQAQADERALRQLSGNAIVYLLQQSRRLDLEPNPRTLKLARSLLSPSWLEQLDAR